jgi:hypothetical protein
MAGIIPTGETIDRPAPPVMSAYAGIHDLEPSQNGGKAVVYHS